MPAPLLNNPQRVHRACIVARLSDLLPRLSLASLHQLEKIVESELSEKPCGDAAAFNLSIQELRLIRSFRSLPDSHRRESVVSSMEMFSQAYA
mgnify:CR=1 FL=1